MGVGPTFFDAFLVVLFADFFFVVFLRAVFLPVVFLRAVFFLVVFLRAGPLARFSASISVARSRSIVSGELPRGSEALVSPSVT